MKSRGWILAYPLVALVFLGCVASPMKMTGYLIGYDSEAVFVVSLSDGKRTNIVSQQPNHWWVCPQYDYVHRVLYAVDNKAGSVVAWKSLRVPPTAVYQAAAGSELAGLLLSNDGGSVYFVEYQHSSAQSNRIIEYSIGSRKWRTVFSGPIDYQQKLEWFDADTLLVTTTSMTRSGTRQSAVGLMKVSDGTITPAFSSLHVAHCELSPDKKVIFVVRDDCGYELREIQNPARARELSVSGVVGRSDPGYPVTFAANDTVVIWRVEHELSPAWLYAVNIKTGASQRLVKAHPWNMQYMNRFPVVSEDAAEE
jgi:hypothetical protein